MNFNGIVNLISLIASSIGFLILLSFASRRPKLMKRVSLQLQMGIALVDITRHIQLHNTFSAEDGFCTLLAFYGFFSDHLYVFLNVAIALNLHLFLLKRYKPKHEIIWTYFIVSVGVSLAINLIPLGFGYLGKSSNNSCYLRSDIGNRRFIKLILVHLTTWPCVIYCLMVSLTVMSQYIFGKIEDIESDIIWLPEVQGLSFMISLNSFTCFLTMFPYLLYGALFDWLGVKSQVFSIVAGFAARTTGMLNLACLLLDFHVWDAIIECSSPHNLLPSTYELTNRTNNGQTDAIGSSRNPILDPPESHGSNDTEREFLIHFL